MNAADLRLEMPRPGVALVVIDRPPANALTNLLRQRIADVWRQLRDDESVRAIVITGAGTRFFSSGLDMGELAEEFERLKSEPQALHERIDRLRWDPESADLWKPIVGAINGYCLAGGWYLAQMCDVRIAADTAQFGIPEVRWGLPAVFTWSLPRRLPLNIALEAVLWAERRFSAQRLYQIGWLNAVVPQSDLLREALDWASEVALMPSESVRAHKRFLYSTANVQADELRSQAENLVRPLYDLPDAQLGIAKFMTNRSASADES